jgi:hypothetical protein
MLYSNPETLALDRHSVIVSMYCGRELSQGTAELEIVISLDPMHGCPGEGCSVTGFKNFPVAVDPNADFACESIQHISRQYHRFARAGSGTKPQQ